MSETPAGAQLVRFDVYELDLHSGELRKSGARLAFNNNRCNCSRCCSSSPASS